MLLRAKRPGRRGGSARLIGLAAIQYASGSSFPHVEPPSPAPWFVDEPPPEPVDARGFARAFGPPAGLLVALALGVAVSAWRRPA